MKLVIKTILLIVVVVSIAMLVREVKIIKENIDLGCRKDIVIQKNDIGLQNQYCENRLQIQQLNRKIQGLDGQLQNLCPVLEEMWYQIEENEKLALKIDDNVIPSIIKAVNPSTVFIKFRHPDFSTTRAGAGIVWNIEGIILTNAHIVKIIEFDERVTGEVQFYDGKRYKIEDYVMIPELDLGVLKIDFGSRKLIPISVGNMVNFKVGQTVLTIGHPIRGPWTVSKGIVSRFGFYQDRNDSFLIQTDVAINPGNSGGPLIALDGKCYGIVTFVHTFSGGNHGLGYVIPISVIEKNVPKLLRDLHFKADLRLILETKQSKRK